MTFLLEDDLGRSEQNLNYNREKTKRFFEPKHQISSTLEPTSDDLLNRTTINVFPCLLPVSLPANCHKYSVGGVVKLQLERKIGKGAFGVVWIGKIPDFSTTKNFAIKIIDKAVCKKKGFTNRILNEIEIHSNLDHPNLVKLEHSFEDSQNWYLVMELCIGGEVHGWIKQHQTRINEYAIREFFTQIVSAVLYLHQEKKIIHRDLKLSNILLDDKYVCKIADFGLANMVIGNEEARTICGTPSYLSPEILCRKAYGFEVDIWSLGIILYSFYSGGKPPFEMNLENQHKILDLIAKKSFCIPSSMTNSDAQNLLSGLLDPNPTCRLNIFQVSQHSFLLHSSISTPSQSFTFSLERITSNIKQTTKHGLVQIENGICVLSFDQDQYYLQSNGMTVTCIQKNRRFKGSEESTYKLDQISTIPEHLIKRLEYMRKFVNLIRSKIVKIFKQINPSFKASLMENGDFYFSTIGNQQDQTRTKLVFDHQTTGVSIWRIEGAEKNLVLDKKYVENFESFLRFSPSLEKTLPCKMKIAILEEYLEMKRIERMDSVSFPLILRNSLSSFASSCATMAPSSLVFPQLGLAGRVFLPAVGWCLKFPAVSSPATTRGDDKKSSYLMLFVDGSQILVDGVENTVSVQHHPGESNRHEIWPINSSIPARIKEKLSHFSNFVRLFKKQQSIVHSRNKNVFI